MKTIVISGSTRGIGLGLAEAFLALDCQVVVNGRSAPSVERTVGLLSSRFPPDHVLGFAGDVTEYDQMQALWDTAAGHFGRVDIWVNNAGIRNPTRKFWEQTPEMMRRVVETNLTGCMYGSQVALRGMLAQGSGGLYNMEGLGSDGRKIAGLVLYGTTKYGLHYLTQALAEEVQDTPVIVGSLSPGMVVTDMLVKDYEGRPEDWERAKRVFNILADRVEKVAPWLVEKILANSKNGMRIKYLTRGKIFLRFVTAPFSHRDLFTNK
jgi:NAD(P)-dependent dehydrogenase (short-subunit alcohol dehydrogenase family)